MCAGGFVAMSAVPPAGAPEPLPPHRELRGYYGDEAARHRYVVDLFDRTAVHYNTVEKLFLNGGLAYRRFGLWRAGLRRGMKVLDVAIGTAAVARGAAKLVGREGCVFGVDPSRGMLGEARKVFRGPLTRGVAEQLPFADRSFDFVTMGIALRHVADLRVAFGQYLRVLKPGGRLWILEGHVPRSAFGQKLTRLMWARVIPGMTLLSTRSRDAKLLMDYYWDTVEQSVPPEAIVAALRDAGFENARFQIIVPGAFIEYTGTRPADAKSAG
jgi:demethylmenaquinone methyltransferase/2-methoxy-6-polyprenyl-1,4-benzoquinol methylase